jgi:hypothetical protein
VVCLLDCTAVMTCAVGITVDISEQVSGWVGKCRNAETIVQQVGSFFAINGCAGASFSAILKSE